MATKHPSPREGPIIVIGAGVLGLSSAILLQSRYPDHAIAIIAAEFPGDSTPSPDYASAWAGAHYRPIPGSTQQLKFEAELARRTFRVMKTIAKETPEAGVQLLPGVEYLEKPPEANLALRDGDEYAGKDDGFRIFRAEELPKGVKWGCEYQSFCVNVPVYCSHLNSRFVEKGGRLIRRKLANLLSAFEVAREEGLDKPLTVVNCSGRNFDTDTAVSIIRGQTCLVRNQYGKTVTRQNSDGSWAALIPRPLNGGTIVGVSKEIGDMEGKARAATREKMLRQAIEAFPDFVKSEKEFDIITDNVGRRPFREGGLRLEVESLEAGQKRIIHAYGIGGRGYETSWGIAERVLELFSGHDGLQSEQARL